MRDMRCAPSSASNRGSTACSPKPTRRGADAGMMLKVAPLTRKVSLGPDSAGSDPGPICFDRGGSEPTIADCDAILGRLNPQYFLGGKVKLDVEKATRIFKQKCADVLGVG